MLTEIEAENIAFNHIKKLGDFSGLELCIIKSKTINIGVGWVFFYHLKINSFTDKIPKRLGGNSPIIINKFNGSVKTTGTAFPIEKYISDYLNEFDSN